MSEITDIVEHLHIKFAPIVILLGGSRATNTYLPRSDWDLYLIGEYPEENEQAPEIFEDKELDISLFPLSRLREEDCVLKIFYGPVPNLRVLSDSKNDIGKKIVSATKSAYDRGPTPLSATDRERKLRYLSRILRKIDSYLSEPIVATFHIAFFYQAILPAWFELQNRWSVPVHQALPIIEGEDSEFVKILREMTHGEISYKSKACHRALKHIFALDESSPKHI